MITEEWISTDKESYSRQRKELMLVPLEFLIGHSNGCAHIYDLFLNEPNDRIKEYTWKDMTEKGISVNTPIHVVN